MLLQLRSIVSASGAFQQRNEHCDWKSHDMSDALSLLPVPKIGNVQILKSTQINPTLCSERRAKYTKVEARIRIAVIARRMLRPPVHGS